MNYLAHAFLSFDDNDVLAGNMFGDFVKGKNYLKFPLPVQTGILLHRFIDRFTDEHPLTHEAMSVFKPTFLLSAGVFTDIFFDHFLANDHRYFNDTTLMDFTMRSYSVLHQYHALFDDRMRTFFGYMSEHNWLYHYKHREGIERSVRGICKRYPRLGDAEKALQIFENNYQRLQKTYEAFFPVLMADTRVKLQALHEDQGAS